MRLARNGYPATSAFSFLGELNIHFPMVLGDQAVVKIIIFNLKKNGFPVHIFPRLKKVHNFRGDQHTVGVYELHGDEAKQTNEEQRNESVFILKYI